MLRSYFITTIRTLYRNKVYSAINIAGLALGIAAAFSIAKYVGFTFTYDNFHQHKDHVFLIQQTETKNGLQRDEQASTYWGVATMAAELYPEVVHATHFSFNAEMLVMTTGGGKTVSFNENRVCTVDTSFFSIFSFPVIAGDMSTALSVPNAIVLTESVATKYFGERDPIGQVMTTRMSWGAETSHKVTAVIEDVPINSTLQFDFLICAGLGPAVETYWLDPSHTTYLLLDEHADPAALARKMSGEMGTSATLKADGKEISFSLRQLSDIKLTPNQRMLAMIGVFILVISWINFINLSTGRARSRAKETGIRKVVGATRKQLTGQIILECLLINSIALILALGFFVVASAWLSQMGNNKVLPFLDDPTPVNWIFAFMFIIGALASSTYPAMFISAVNPIRALKGKFIHGRHSVIFRKALVVAQFTISVICAVGVFVVSDQLRYMQNKDPKIDVSHVLAIKAPKDRWYLKMERLTTFKNEAMNMSAVENVTSCTTIPGISYRHEVNFGLTTGDDRHLFYVADVDESFFPLFGVHFLAGKPFNADTPAKNRRSVT